MPSTCSRGELAGKFAWATVNGSFQFVGFGSAEMALTYHEEGERQPLDGRESGTQNQVSALVREWLGRWVGGWTGR